MARMKFIECDNCGKDVPDYMDKCPFCGEPLYEEDEDEEPDRSSGKGRNVIVGVVVVIVVLVMGILIGQGWSPSENQKATVGSEESTQPSGSASEKEVDRERIIDIDKKVIGICSEAESLYQDFLDSPKKEGASDLTYYNSAKTASNRISQLRLELSDVKLKEIAEFDDYKESAMVYMYTMMDAANKAMKYIDDPTTGKLSDLQEAVEQVSPWMLNCTAKRVAFFGAAGFATDEIPKVESYGI